MSGAGTGPGRPAWLAGLGTLLDGLRIRRLDDTPLEDALEEAVLGAPRRYTRTEVAQHAGLELDEAKRLWRALGFPETGDDEVLFTDRDVEAARVMGRLTEVGLLDPDVREAVARAVAQQMSRLADWQVGMLKRLVEAQPDEVSPEQSLELAAAAIPALEHLQDWVWRRHLAAAVSRMLVLGTAGDDDRQFLAVGFADMVGFTRTTRRRSTTELAEMIERFAACTTDVIAEGHGRIVKTVGDEVLFVTDDIAEAAEIALALQERIAAEPALPELRIGVAAGPVLLRFGDVYGEVVNIAARLTAHARPNAVLVDRAVAEALADDERFRLSQRRAVKVRGYHHLHPWRLRRAPQRG